MNREEFINIYWNYYLMLEKDFINITKYVKIKKRNYSTCSDEIIKLIEVIGSECDLILKKICGINLNSRSGKITEYSKILNTYPEIVNEKIEVKHTDIILEPFKGWNKRKPWQLFWWKTYNKIKHNREENYDKGKFFMLLNSLAALYFLEMYFCRKIGRENYEIDVPNIKSKLFNIINWEVNPKTKSILVEESFNTNNLFDIELPYIVGEAELEVYLDGEKLLLATQENGLDDGHYIEVGERGKVSHYIKFYNWGDTNLEKGDIVHIAINRHEE